MKGIAIRRHHRRRMQAKARKVYRGLPKAARYADHLAVCSCWMCGNQRRHGKGKEKLTVTEKRMTERQKETPEE